MNENIEHKPLFTSVSPDMIPYIEANPLFKALFTPIKI